MTSLIARTYAAHMSRTTLRIKAPIIVGSKKRHAAQVHTFQSKKKFNSFQAAPNHRKIEIFSG
jgi:flagellar assembly factor FliW